MDQYPYYVYALIDLRTNKPFYIGKGKGNRASKHLQETKDNTCNIFKFRKIKSLMKAGFSIPIVKFYEHLDEDTAYYVEELLIRSYGRIGRDPDGILTNICFSSRPPSAKGQKRSDETKRKLSDAAKKRPLELVELHSNRLRQIAADRIGKPKSNEAIKKFVAKMIGRTCTEDTKRKISEANKGKPNVNKGKCLPKETCEKMSLAMRGNTNGRKHISDDILDQIIKLHKEGKTSRFIAEALGIGRGVVLNRIKEI
jgi:hypothetical protein